MSEIKPIETVYKGYRFRSRLEARWAYYFDLIGIEWRYETEGYDTPHGKYLPDFYLPELQAYVEIKYLHYYLENETEYEKYIKGYLLDLVNSGICKIALSICGDPYDYSMLMIHKIESHRFLENKNGVITVVDGACFMPLEIGYNNHPCIGYEEDGYICPLCDWLSETYSILIKCYRNAWSESRMGTNLPLEKDDILRKSEYFFTNERIKARQARFEHGETPEGENR